MADTPENERTSPAKSADPEIWDTIVKWLRLVGRHGFHILAGGILVTGGAIGAAKYSPFLGHVFCDVLGCSDGPPPPPPPLPPLCVPADPPTNPCRAARIVVFDTAYPDEAYNHDLEANGETNAHFVVRQLRLENVDAVPAIIGRDQSTRDSFLVPVPDVVVIHRSTFERSNGGDGDTAIALLIAAAPKTTRFVIYSRKTGTDEGYAQTLETRGGAQGRVDALTLKKGDPWADPAQIRLLLTAINRQIAASAGSAAMQSTR